MLGKEEIPSLNETIAIIRGEGQRGVMMEPQSADGGCKSESREIRPAAVKYLFQRSGRK